VISRAEDEAEQVLAAARARADEMITDSALVATARGRSEQILHAARNEAARLLREADEYCDRRLALFEDDLERAMAQVRRGRERLRERSDLESLDTLQAHGTDADGVEEPAEVEYAEEYTEEYVEEYTEEYVETYVEVEVFDGRSEDTADEPGEAAERQTVGVGAQREHRVVDVAAVERAAAEAAGLGQRVNLQ
jgi:cell division septum initiation protein DivIVA